MRDDSAQHALRRQRHHPPQRTHPAWEGVSPGSAVERAQNFVDRGIHGQREGHRMRRLAGHRGVDEPGAQRHRVDAATREIHAQTVHEGVHGRLRGAVRGVSWQGSKASDGPHRRERPGPCDEHRRDERNHCVRNPDDVRPQHVDRRFQVRVS